MSSYVEIGQIIDLVPKKIQVTSPKIESPKTDTPSINSNGQNGNQVNWGAVLLIGLTIGGLIIYFKSKQNESINTSDKS